MKNVLSCVLCKLYPFIKPVLIYSCNISDYSEEVGIEMKTNLGVPTDCTSNFVVDFVWKSTSFDRY